MKEGEAVYLDTSALLPYYREEPASEAVERFLRGLSPPVVISQLTRVEFFSAVARWVRVGEITEKQAVLLERTFVGDVEEGLFSVRRVEPPFYREAERWIRARGTPLRTLDALHLACCGGYGLELATCDAQMHRASEALGIPSIFLRG